MEGKPGHHSSRVGGSWEGSGKERLTQQANGGSQGGTEKGLSQGLSLALPRTEEGDLGSEYGAYLARLRDRIHESLRYPPAALRRGLSGTVHAEIVIQPDGTIGSVSLLRSSSHRVLDEAVVGAARRLQPLPFPDGLPRRTLRVRVPVVFELR